MDKTFQQITQQKHRQKTILFKITRLKNFTEIVPGEPLRRGVKPKLTQLLAYNM